MLLFFLTPCYTCLKRGDILNIGEKIKEARKKAKLSQRELGERLGVSQAMIGQYESGKRNPKIEQLQRLASALKCDISEFLSVSDALPALNKDFSKNEIITDLQKYLESLGYLILREDHIDVVQKNYIDFELSENEKLMLKKYGYIKRHELPYFIKKDNLCFRLSEKQFNDMTNEINESIEFQLWKYRVK